MNTIAGKALPETKLSDEFDKSGYGILIVAEKYQTGFDQPKLCGMYVDKTLTGVNAVQTLSRLNRSFPGKDNVYVLDFRNTAEHIRAAFEPFYQRTEAEPSDPNVLFDAADTVRDFAVITDEGPCCLRADVGGARPRRGTQAPRAPLNHHPDGVPCATSLRLALDAGWAMRWLSHAYIACAATGRAMSDPPDAVSALNVTFGPCKHDGRRRSLLFVGSARSV